MAVVLSEDILGDVYETIRRTFSDVHIFDVIIASRLQQAIADSNTMELNILNVKNLISRYYDVESFVSEEQKAILAQIKLIFYTSYVLIKSYHSSSKNLTYNTMEQLLNDYGDKPEFGELLNYGDDHPELEYILKFRNYMKIALTIIPARLNKSTLIRIGARLEGSQTEYVTGGGQTSACTRRVIIYEKEGRIIADKRPPRAPRAAPNTVTDKSKGKKLPSNKLKIVNNIRLTENDLALLIQPPRDPTTFIPMKFDPKPQPNNSEVKIQQSFFNQLNNNVINPINLSLNEQPEEVTQTYNTLEDLMNIGNINSKHPLEFSHLISDKPTKVQRFQSSQSDMWGIENPNLQMSNLTRLFSATRSNSESANNEEGLSKIEPEIIDIEPIEEQNDLQNNVDSQISRLVSSQISWDVFNGMVSEDLGYFFHFMKSAEMSRTTSATSPNKSNE
eukprot:gene10003-13458_t